jgi:LEA14-like dessication related protein
MKGLRSSSIALCASLLAGCASTGALVEVPQVSLRKVEVKDVDLKSQTFVLDFDVTNPNPFPLPIQSVSYGVELDGYRFASGETQASFTVPASSDGSFAISVDLNLMRTAPALFFIVREGVYREIPYELEGEFDLDIPLAVPVAFRTRGHIQMHTPTISAERND